MIVAMGSRCSDFGDAEHGILTNSGGSGYAFVDLTFELLARFREGMILGRLIRLWSMGYNFYHSMFSFFPPSCMLLLFSFLYTQYFRIADSFQRFGFIALLRWVMRIYV